APEGAHMGSLVVLVVTLTVAAAVVGGSTARSADGVPIRFHVAGRGEPTLVLVHGWALDHRVWDGQAPSLEGRHRVVTLDLAGPAGGGAGAGPRPRDRDGARDLARRAAPVLVLRPAARVARDQGQGPRGERGQVPHPRRGQPPPHARVRGHPRPGYRPLPDARGPGAVRSRP